MKTLTFTFLFFVFFFLSANAFDITKILNKYPEFSSFNSYLTQTKIADAINSRQTITVLAVDNGAASMLSTLSQDQLKMAMSVHVVLDYYDNTKLQKLSKKTSLLTTLFQTSGTAIGQQGFLNVTVTKSGVVFGSAVPGSSLNANLVNSVVEQPYNISVLQISSAIVPPSVTQANATSSPPPAPVASPKNAPTAAPEKAPTAAPEKAPTAAPEKAPVAAPEKAPTAAPEKAPATPSPSPSKASPPAPDATAPSPSDSESAAPSEAPVAPAPMPTDAEAPGPAAFPEIVGDAPGPAVEEGASSGVRVVSSTFLAVVLGVFCWAAL